MEAYETPEMLAAKTDLNTYCQQILRRPLSKEDVEWLTIQLGEYRQTILHVKCLKEAFFAGQLCLTEKGAERSVAAMALEFYNAQYGTFDEMDASRWKDMDDSNKAAIFHALSNPSDPLPIPPNSSLTYKAVLNTLCTRAAGRTLVKGDTRYTTEWRQDGFRATVQVHALPDPWSSICWTGKACFTKRDAEQHCAKAALTCLTASHVIMRFVEASTQAPAGEAEGSAQVLEAEAD